MESRFRLKILILSAVLITICSGLLFYRQLFMDEIKTEFGSKVDLEELRFEDQQTNSAMLYMRINLSESSDEILQHKSKINDLLNVILDMRKNNANLKKSLGEIKEYFVEKNKNIDKFLLAIRELQASLKSMNPIYLELQKNNIKFILDGKDFYRECITDSLMFLIAPTKDVEWKFNEDIKILTQIMGFSKTPNLIIEKYYKAMETIRKKSKEIEVTINENKEKNISPQISAVIKYDNENKENGDSRGQTFLYLIFGAIIIYVGSVIFVMRTL